VIGSSGQLRPVIDFSDAAIFAMAVANIIGFIYFLMPIVKKRALVLPKTLKICEIVKFKDRKRSTK